MLHFLLIALLPLSTLSHGSHLDRRDSAPSPVLSFGPDEGLQAMQKQLKSDITAVSQSFQDAINTNLDPSTDTTLSGTQTATLLKSITDNINKYQLNQNMALGTKATQDKLNSMASAIGDTLDSISKVTVDIFNDQTNGAVVFEDLKNCITGLVAQGGLHTGESCVTQNGMSISGVGTIMKSVLNNYATFLPTSILDTATKALDPNFKPIFPGQAKFAQTINDAFESVQASVSGDLVTALDSARQCFQESMTQTTFASASAFVESCEYDPTNQNSVYTQMKTLYLSVVNQFVGYVAPNLLDAMHSIANDALGITDDTYTNDNDEQEADPEFVRKAIYNSTKSIVATNLDTKDIAYELAKCMDTLVVSEDLQTAIQSAEAQQCLSKPDGPILTSAEVVRSYIGQVYGVLPPLITSRIKSSGIDRLDPNDPNYQKKVDAYQAEFDATNVGPQYVTCYNQFLDCLFDPNHGALGADRDPTQQTCLLGDACDKGSPDGNQIANPFSARKRDMLRSHFTPTTTRRYIHQLTTNAHAADVLARFLAPRGILDTMMSPYLERLYAAQAHNKRSAEISQTSQRVQKRTQTYSMRQKRRPSHARFLSFLPHAQSEDL